MAKHKIKDPKAIVFIVLGSISFPAMIVLFTMGGVFFSKENDKVLNYVNSMCQVDSRFYKQYQYKTRANRYSCYGPIWNVHHEEKREIFAIVEGEKRYLYSSDALNKAYEYQIGSSYSCWYDLRNPSIAQWDQPNTHMGTILLCCAGLSALLTILFLFLIVQLVRQEIRRDKHNNMNVYSNPNDCIKQ